MDVSILAIMKDKTLRFWLSHESPQLNNYATQRYSQAVMDILQRYPIPTGRVLPSKSFHTRRNKKKGLSFRSFSETFEEDVNVPAMLYFAYNKYCFEYQRMLKEEKRSPLSNDWQTQSFKIKRDDLRDNLSSIANKIPEMNKPKTRTDVEIFLPSFKLDIDETLVRLVELLTKITSMAEIKFNLMSTELTDEGCHSISKLIRTSKTITSIKILLYDTNITDEGVRHIAFMLPFPPLQVIYLNFSNTHITDEGIMSISESLRHISSRLKSFSLMINHTRVSDDGFIPVLDILSCISSLSELVLYFWSCLFITDRSGERIIYLLQRCENISKVVIDMSNTGMMIEGKRRIQEAQSSHHLTFTLTG
eukprot:TRINITY_DN3863_c0_g1_i1.p1 TRINITY_DN3863_c0_g1~~TRINITY_DN3863_c0_g1_i1.p1  ORF type:complete len:363 (+),score=30.90 TRINITY_DN3863_c0_g1_i1:403-1491(+)